MREKKELKVFWLSGDKKCFDSYALAYSKEDLIAFLNTLCGCEYKVSIKKAYHKVVHYEETNTYDIIYYAPHLRNSVVFKPRYVVTISFNKQPTLPFMDTLGDHLQGSNNSLGVLKNEV